MKNPRFWAGVFLVKSGFTSGGRLVLGSTKVKCHVSEMRKAPWLDATGR